MTGFAHDIAGGQGNLVATSFQSPKFQHLVQGWQVTRDGSAEFNDLTIRGTFFGTDFIINSAGAFFYSGTPAAGNLIISVTTAAGTDTFGNAYKADVSVYGSNSSYAQLLTSALPFLARLSLGTGNAFEATPATIMGGVLGGGTTSNPFLEIDGPTVSGSPASQAFMQLFAATEDLSAEAQWYVQVGDTTATKHGIISILPDSISMQAGNGAGPAIKVGAANNVTMTAGTPASPTVVTTDAWHVIGAGGQPAFGAGFGAPGAGDQTARFQLQADGTVLLDGVVLTTAATAANATLFTLPGSAYIPLKRKRLAGVTSASGYTTAGQTLVNVAPATGVVSLVPACSGAGQQIVLDGMRFPVG
jgi:hypothetical protein